MADRVGILGAGAVGGMLAVLLAEAGHDVTVLASERTSTAINVDGVALRSGRFGERRALVPARPYLTAPVDVLFVAVKAPDLLAALSRVPPALLADAAVAPLLNGTDHVALLRAALPQAAVVPMTVSVEATRVGPGVIEHVSPFAEYALAQQRERARVDPEDMLRAAGLDVDASAPDEATLLWRKLSFLAPLALLTTHARQPIGPAAEAHPDLLEGWSSRPRPRRPRQAPRSTRRPSRSGSPACRPGCARRCSRTRSRAPRWSSTPSPGRSCVPSPRVHRSPAPSSRRSRVPGPQPHPEAAARN